jgi:predicted glycosyltransferase
VASKRETTGGDGARDRQLTARAIRDRDQRLRGIVRIWLDMANSPHPVLLGPVARELETRGHELFVTTRDHAQTRDLTLSIWPDATVVGGESPGSRGAKARAIVSRVLGLRRVLAASQVDAAVSLGSYAQIVAARSLGVKVLTLMDYEYQPANHLSFRLAHCVVVPSTFPAERLRQYGASVKRVAKFCGFKEELYLDQVDALSDPIEIENGRSLAVFRPPPEGALYHQRGNAIFDLVLRLAITREDVEVVVLPRMAHQRSRYSEMAGVQAPEHAIDGLALLRSADIFVGAGGTMSREAALLGVRAYTIFAGERPAVDAELIRRGLLRDLRGGDPMSVDWTPRDGREKKEACQYRRERGRELRDWLTARIEELA